MTEKILAFVDASIYAKSVCEHAAWAAGRTGREIDLFHVLGRREAPERQDLSGTIALGARSALLAELSSLDEQRARLGQARGHAILDDAREIAVAAGAKAGAHLRRGDIMETLSAQEKNAALVMIGKRGEAADFAKGHLGSNLERVVRAVKKPVFIASRAFTEIKTALIAVDGGPSAKRAVEYVISSPLFKGLSITAAAVGEASSPAAKGLDDAAAKLERAGMLAEKTLLQGQVENTLSPLVNEGGYNMLVMGSHGHSRIRSLMIGSTTTEMIRSCKTPVMLIC